jgi:hypothetical protein
MNVGRNQSLSLPPPSTLHVQLGALGVIGLSIAGLDIYIGMLLGGRTSVDFNTAEYVLNGERLPVVSDGTSVRERCCGCKHCV